MVFKDRAGRSHSVRFGADAAGRAVVELRDGRRLVLPPALQRKFHGYGEPLDTQDVATWLSRTLSPRGAAAGTDSVADETSPGTLLLDRSNTPRLRNELDWARFAGPMARAGIDAALDPGPDDADPAARLISRLSIAGRTYRIGAAMAMAPWLPQAEAMIESNVRSLRRDGIDFNPSEPTTAALIRAGRDDVNAAVAEVLTLGLLSFPVG